MQNVTVSVPGQEQVYPVWIHSGLLPEAQAYFAPYKGHRAAIITDEHVGPLYAQALEAALNAAGLVSTAVTLPAGETTKCQECLSQLYDFLLDSKITRADLIIALGGGVIGDLAGYAAASYLRGVPFVQVPTTLLAQVDSSVGGKVAINHARGKNLLGAFYQPQLVLIDTDTLDTLDARQVGAGLGEVIKYGCILDADLFDQIEQAGGREGLRPLYPQIVARCIQLKADVVAQDPLDKGLRMILNFGHTLAHAIENASGYGVILHGEAVCIGMVHAARWGEHLGITPKGTSERIVRVLQMYDLPTAVPDSLTLSELLPRMALDKKSVGSAVRVIVLDQIGACHAVSLTVDEIAACESGI